MTRTTRILTATCIALLLAPHVAQPASACPPAPSAVRDLDLSGYYLDRAKSVVDPAAKARKRTAVRPLKDFLNGVTKLADRAVRSNPRDSAKHAACALRWLRHWASEGAYLGRMASKQAQAQRKWDLAGLALAYLKVRGHAEAADKTLIEPWLREIADRARAVYDDPGKIRNNHWYWLGLGLGAVGIATDSPRHWREARRIMKDAARDIRDDGLLPLELKRGRRALHYHTFAAMPLVTLAELAASRDEDWYALNSAALHRLVRATAAGLVDPTRFDRAAGLQQERPARPRAGWLQLYQSRFQNELPPRLPAAKAGHRWLGGNVGNLRTVLSRREI